MYNKSETVRKRQSDYNRKPETERQKQRDMTERKRDMKGQRQE